MKKLGPGQKKECSSEADVLGEDQVVVDARVRVSELGGRGFRNTVGSYKTKDGYIQYGLGPKTSDIVGWVSTVITPEMVGTKVAIFLAIECKEGGWNHNKKLNAHEQAQKNFLDIVKQSGGRSGFATSTQDVEDIMND